MSELKLAVNYQWSDDKNHYQITSNWNDVSSDFWDDNYVNFTGYFGKYGPDVFAAAPELYEMLHIARDYVAAELEDEKQAYKGYESSSNIPTIKEDLERIDAALAKARGESL